MLFIPFRNVVFTFFPVRKQIRKKQKPGNKCFFAKICLIQGFPIGVFPEDAVYYTAILFVKKTVRR